MRTTIGKWLTAWKTATGGGGSLAGMSPATLAQLPGAVRVRSGDCLGAVYAEGPTGRSIESAAKAG